MKRDLIFVPCLGLLTNTGLMIKQIFKCISMVHTDPIPKWNINNVF